jgi:hypothetical protein
VSDGIGMLLETKRVNLKGLSISLEEYAHNPWTIAYQSPRTSPWTLEMGELLLLLRHLGSHMFFESTFNIAILVFIF